MEIIHTFATLKSVISNKYYCLIFYKTLMAPIVIAITMTQLIYILHKTLMTPYESQSVITRYHHYTMRK